MIKAASLIAFSIASIGVAQAQYIGTLPPNIDGHFFYSDDSDHFQVTSISAGTTLESGVGARIGYSTYHGPTNYKSDMDGARYTSPTGFSASSEFAQFTFVKFDKDYSFQGKIGARNISNRVDKDAVIRDISSKSGHAVVPDDPSSNLPFTENRNYLISEAELRVPINARMSVGASFGTDVVESIRSIMSGTRYVYSSVDVDYRILENLNFSAVVGNMHFSDNNDRFIFKTKTIYTFLPEYGVSTYIRTKYQSESTPGSLNYFSPAHLDEEAVGLQVRYGYSGLVFTAGGDYGIQHVKRADDSTGSDHVYNWNIGVQTRPNQRTGVTYGATLSETNSSITSSSSDYSWTSVNAWVKIPF